MGRALFLGRCFLLPGLGRSPGLFSRCSRSSRSRPASRRAARFAFRRRAGPGRSRSAPSPASASGIDRRRHAWRENRHPGDQPRLNQRQRQRGAEQSVPRRHDDHRHEQAGTTCGTGRTAASQKITSRSAASASANSSRPRPRCPWPGAIAASSRQAPEKKSATPARRRSAPAPRRPRPGQRHRVQRSHLHRVLSRPVAACSTATPKEATRAIKHQRRHVAQSSPVRRVSSA